MPNTKSAEKRNKTNLVRNERNRIRRSTMRTAIKKLRKAESYEAAVALLPEVFSTIDKNAKVHVIHPRTAARYKSRLSLFVQTLQKPAKTEPKA